MPRVLDDIKGVGKFQWICMLLFGVAAAKMVMVNFMILYIAPRSIEFYCDDPAQSYQNLSEEERTEVMSSTGSSNECERPDLDFSTMTSAELRANLTGPGSNQSHRSTPCRQFVYDHTMFSMTITERFNLVCDRQWIISLSKSIYMAGYLVGALGSGALADRFGRKMVVVSSALLCTAWHLMTAFAPSVELFLLSRFLLAVCSVAFFTAGQILHTELVRKDQRKIPRAILSYSIGIVGIIISGIVFLIRTYQNIEIMQSVSSLVFGLLVWYQIPESPRWLCAQHREDDAHTIITRIAKFNRWKEDRLDYLLQIDSTDTHTKTTLLDLFRTPLLRRRTLIICTLWFCHILVVYALIYNLDSFWPDVRVSTIMSGSIELLTLAIPTLTIDVFGRQFMSSFFLVTCGLCCLCMGPFVTVRGSPWLLTFAICGKFMAINQFFIGTVFTQELFPTNVRTQGLGMASTVSRLGGILAPQLGHLDSYWAPLSVVVMGSVAILSGLLVPLLPDTTGTELPTTLHDGENFQKHHTYQVQIAFLRRRGSKSKGQDRPELNGLTGKEEEEVI